MATDQTPVLTVNSRIMFPSTDVYEVVQEDLGTHVRVTHALNGGRPTVFYVEKQGYTYDEVTGIWQAGTLTSTLPTFTLKRPSIQMVRPLASGSHGAHRPATIAPGPVVESTGYPRPYTAPSVTTVPSNTYVCTFEKRRAMNAAEQQPERITVTDCPSLAAAETRARQVIADALKIPLRQVYLSYKLVNASTI